MTIDHREIAFEDAIEQPFATPVITGRPTLHVLGTDEGCLVSV
jgi:hypothetical protein